MRRSRRAVLSLTQWRVRLCHYWLMLDYCNYKLIVAWSVARHRFQCGRRFALIILLEGCALAHTLSVNLVSGVSDIKSCAHTHPPPHLCRR
ncbi:30S ribosomal protein S16 [Candidatus Hodgkinia cicadicola]|nr:30S ribosomal protein S16 [Candidatus Hodgkinia cicadicola]